jgi:hypothetical protein
VLFAWVDDPAVLAVIARDEELALAAPDHRGPDPVAEGVAEDEGSPDPCDEAGRSLG